MSDRSSPVATGTPPAVLAGAFLFNLGQGALRPTLPLYLQHTFSANYRMVTAIPTAFGLGKWIASLPTGYLLPGHARTLMAGGLLLIAASDVASVSVSSYAVFLALRGLGGVGWAMFSTVATTAAVDRSHDSRRGRSVSILLMSETAGLLVGTAVSGHLYRGVGTTGPFLLEAACMLAAAFFARRRAAEAPSPPGPGRSRDRRLLRAVLRTPGVPLLSLTGAVLIAIQTGALVFLLPLHVVEHGGAGPDTLGLIVGVGVLGRFVALWIGGSASDRWGRVRVLIPGLAAYAALLAALPALSHPGTLGLWSFLTGAVAGLVAPLPPAFIGDRVAPPLRGVAVGWLRWTGDVGQVAGPLVMGAAADALGLSSSFALAAILLIATAASCWYRARRGLR